MTILICSSRPSLSATMMKCYSFVGKRSAATGLLRGWKGRRDSSALAAQIVNYHHHHPRETSACSRDFIDCHGDYRDEAYLEDSHLPLYSNQASLPRLPVPTLEETIAHFLPAALAFAKNPAEADRLEASCRVFPEQAAQLQKRLLKRADDFNHDDSSWLQSWRNKFGYLRNRESLFYLSNFDRLAYDEPIQGDAIARAAAILQATAIYAQFIQCGQLPHDQPPQNQDIRNKIDDNDDDYSLHCTTQLKYLFNACRIPLPDADVYRIYTNEQLLLPFTPQHAVVACRGHFYKIPLVEKKDGRVLHIESLKQLLQDVVHLSQHPSPRVPELGWMTATHRDMWSSNYYLLTERCSGIRLALEELQSALCVIAIDLDDNTFNNKDLASINEEYASSASTKGAPVISSPTLQMKRLWHGNVKHSANRWYDKSIQLIVTQDGEVGWVAEPSMMDEMPAIRNLCDYVLSSGRFGTGNHHASLPGKASQQPYMCQSHLKVTPLFEHAFELLDEKARQEIQARVQEAKHEVLERIRQHDLQVLTYEKFGSLDIRKAGFDPDAFVQMALQLAAYQVFGNEQVVVASSSSSTHHALKFLHGRKEFTRCVSPQSQAFVQAMLSTSSWESQRAALSIANRAHSECTRKASNSVGVDSHFNGLMLLLKEGERVPDLFLDPLYQTSKKLRLCTSSTTVPRAAQLGLLSQVNTADDLGIKYDIQAHECTFTITGRTNLGLVERMHTILHKSLDDMKSFVFSSHL